MGAYLADEAWTTTLLIFPFWSCFVSYRGSSTISNLKRGKALTWFLVLPSLVYLFSIGLLAALLASVTR
jgi:nucleoside recognition membrane protein YjiH